MEDFLISQEKDFFKGGIEALIRFGQASMSKIQGLLKASLTVFKDLQLMKDTERSVKMLD